MTDSNFWLVILGATGLLATVATATWGLLWIIKWILRRIESLIRAVLPERVASAVLGIARFYVWAALFCGVAAFGISLRIVGSDFPDDPADPLLRSPLLWLTWLAVMTGIMAIGIVGGLLARYALETIAARLRVPPAKGQ